MNHKLLKYYIRHLVILSLATVVDVAFIVLLCKVNYFSLIVVCIFGGYLLVLPVWGLIRGLVYVIKDTHKLRNIKEGLLLAWAIVALLTIPLAITTEEIRNNQVRYYYDLPDNTTLTIWQDRIIFEKYTSFFPPRSNYIKLPNGTDNWELVIDTAGSSAIWMYGQTDKIKQVSPKYPLVATYEDSAGKYWISAEFPPQTWMAHCEYHYYHDGIASAGFYSVTTVANDSAIHVNGSFDGRDYARYDQGEPRKEPLYSLVLSFSQHIKYYEEYNHWSDSTQYSAFHKKITIE